MISSNEIVLFMKGTKSFPQCGFSATVVQILSDFDCEYTTFNVLSDPEIRQGIKTFSDWPTIPQLYVKGEFLGGCDIVKDMHQSGELAGALGTVIKEVHPPKIQVTDKAKSELMAALKDAGDGQFIHLSVSNGFEHGMHIDGKTPGALEVKTDNGLTLFVDRSSAPRAEGLVIDYEEGADGAGFKMDNPNKPNSVVEMSVQQLKNRLDKGDIKLVDVRKQSEHDHASIKGSTLLSESFLKELQALDKATEIAFHCHHGSRSRKMAESFIQQGFTKIYNVTGGIDAWSKSVDSTVPTY